jgi:hypothetical protein
LIEINLKLSGLNWVKARLKVVKRSSAGFFFCQKQATALYENAKLFSNYMGST